MIQNNFNLGGEVINNSSSIDLTLFSNVNIIVSGQGLKYSEDNLIEVDYNNIVIKAKNIDNQPNSDFPSTLVKIDNTINVSGEYNNEFRKLTIDCMDNQYQNVSGTINIPDNTALQKIGGQLVFAPVGSIVISGVYYEQIFQFAAYKNGFLKMSSSGANCVLTSGVNLNEIITTAPNDYFLLTQSGSIKQQQQVSFQNQIQTETSLLKIIDNRGSINFNEIGNSSTGLQQLQTNQLDNSYLVYPPNATPYTIYINTSGVQQYSIPSSNGQVLAYQSGSMQYITLPSGVVLNTLLSQLNTQSYVNLSQIQPDSSGNITYLRSYSDGTRSWNQVSMTEIIDQSAALQSMQINDGVIDTYVLSCNISKLNSNTTGTKKYLQSVSSVNSYQQINYSDLTGQVQISSIQGNSTTQQFLSSTSGVNSWSNLNINFTQISGFINASTQIQDNNVPLSKLTYGTNTQLLSTTGSGNVWINQSSLAINQGQITFSGVLNSLNTLSYGTTSGLFLRTTGSGNTLSWGSPQQQFTPQANSIPYFDGSSIAQTYSGINQMTYFNSSGAFSKSTTLNNNQLLYYNNGPQTLSNGVQSYKSIVIYNPSDFVGTLGLYGNRLSTYMAGDGSIQNTYEYMIQNVHNQPIYYRFPASTTGFIGYTTSQVFGSGLEGMMGMSTGNGDLVAIAGYNASWSLFQSNVQKPYSTLSGVTITQKGYYSTTTWTWTSLSSSQYKNIIEDDLAQTQNQIIDEFMLFKFKKWTYLDSSPESIKKKHPKGHLLKNYKDEVIEKYNVGICFEDILQIHDDTNVWLHSVLGYDPDLPPEYIKTSFTNDQFFMCSSLTLQVFIKQQREQNEKLKQENRELKNRLDYMEQKMQQICKTLLIDFEIPTKKPLSSHSNSFSVVSCGSDSEDEKRQKQIQKEIDDIIEVKIE